MNTTLLRVLRKLRLSHSLNVTGKRTIAGTTFRFPIRGQLGWGHLQDAETWMTSLLGSLTAYFESKHDHCFVDVGVNIGQTLVKYRAIYRRGAYVGFEPNPVCVAYATELAALNGWQDVEFYPVGIADVPALCTLHYFEHSADDSSASMIENFRPDRPIRQRTYIAVFPIHQAGLKRPVSFLKIDVEGAELEVLIGSREMIRRDRPLVSTEILPCYSRDNAFRIERQRQVELIMSQVGYSCYRIAKAGPAYGELAGLERIASIGIQREVHMSDYLWIPNEASEEIAAMIIDAGRSAL